MSETENTRPPLLPAPWILHKREGYTIYWVRTCEPTAAGLIEALGELPPDTRLETTTGAEGCGEPSAIMYWPGEQVATI